MEFRFTEEEEMLRKLVQDFVKGEIAPRAKELATLDYLPWDILKRIGDLKLLGLMMPEEYGGEAGNNVMLGIACEEIGKASDTVAGILVVPYGCVSVLAQYGTREAKDEWLASMISGEKLMCIAMTEPDCGADAAAIKLRARREGDFYVLNGEKTSITFGMQANAATLFAKTNPDAGARGVTAFHVPLDLPGIHKSGFTDMGWTPAVRASLIFDNVKVPAKYRLGEEGQGFHIVMSSFDVCRATGGLVCLGMVQAAVDSAVTYVQQRTTFGRPLVKWEGVSFKISEAATLIEAARWLCYRALYLADQGLPFTKESAMIKWWVPEIGIRIINDMLVLHGHIGYSDEYPLQTWLRNAIGFQLADGPPQIMKIVIAREIMGKIAVPYID